MEGLKFALFTGPSHGDRAGKHRADPIEPPGGADGVGWKADDFLTLSEGRIGWQRRRDQGRAARDTVKGLPW